MENNIVYLIVAAVFLGIWGIVAGICGFFRSQRGKKQMAAILRMRQNGISLKNHAQVACYIELLELDGEKPEEFLKSIDFFDGVRSNSKMSDKPFALFFLPPGRHRLLALYQSDGREESFDRTMEAGKTYVLTASRARGITLEESSETYRIKGLDDKVTAFQPHGEEGNAPAKEAAPEEAAGEVGASAPEEIPGEVQEAASEEVPGEAREAAIEEVHGETRESAAEEVPGEAPENAPEAEEVAGEQEE